MTTINAEIAELTALQNSVSDWAWSQSDLAQHFQVDRTTVRAWQQKGLPVLKKQGAKLLFYPPVAFHWVVGREIINEFNLITLPKNIAIYPIALSRFALGKVTGEPVEVTRAAIELLTPFTEFKGDVAFVCGVCWQLCETGMKSRKP